MKLGSEFAVIVCLRGVPEKLIFSYTPASHGVLLSVYRDEYDPRGLLRVRSTVQAVVWETYKYNMHVP